MFGTRVVVELATPQSGISGDLGLPFVRNAIWDGNRLAIEIEDPDRNNPVLVRRLVELGAEVRYVTRDERTLEDVYLELVGGNDAAA
jgi:ABC-2 type transport system ATP-binding protein